MSRRPSSRPSSPRGSPLLLQRSDTFHDKINRELARQRDRRRQKETAGMQRRGTGRPRPNVQHRELPTHYKLSESVKLRSFDDDDDYSPRRSREWGSPRRSREMTPRRRDVSPRRPASPRDISPRRRRGPRSPRSREAAAAEASRKEPPTKAAVSPDAQVKKKDKQPLEKKALAKSPTITTPGKKANAKKDIQVDLKRAKTKQGPDGEMTIKVSTPRQTAAKITTDLQKKQAAVPKKGAGVATELQKRVEKNESMPTATVTKAAPMIAEEEIGSSTEEEILRIWEPQALFGGERRGSTAQRRASEMSDQQRHRAIVRRHEADARRRSTAASIVSSGAISGPEALIAKRTSILKPDMVGIENLNAWPGVGIVSLPNREKMIPPGTSVNVACQFCCASIL
eukprot:Gregarina_sp_Poly_1__3325@NODE_1957_length_2998_cov_35_809962_g1260_i0_p1_GENE_NODE_1957_length_2998_cov_35_809962_g1260_i0NODE_1957_length_2998_cov_35_809962_g1260_i0_p1_ORF_typecomplete_len398_score62_42Red1/PF07964_11/2_9_NODE_1957_length_2998_cov_35_809962_g1260_i07731966